MTTANSAASAGTRYTDVLRDNVNTTIADWVTDESRKAREAAVRHVIEAAAEQELFADEDDPTEGAASAPAAAPVTEETPAVPVEEAPAEPDEEPETPAEACAETEEASAETQEQSAAEAPEAQEPAGEEAAAQEEA